MCSGRAHSIEIQVTCTYKQIINTIKYTVLMLLLITGGFIPSDKGAGGGYSYPGIREGRSQKNFFCPSRPQFGLNIRGWGGGRASRAPPLDPPLLMARLKP